MISIHISIHAYIHPCSDTVVVVFVVVVFVVFHCGNTTDFDAILLETTGLADPAPIIYTIQTNSKMSENYFIDSIVCLADAKNITLHLDEKKPDGAVNEAYQQVAFADKILLNKIDLVTPQENATLKDRLAKINKFASVIETERSRAPLEKILGLNSFNMESILAVDPDFFESQEGDTKHNLEVVQSVGIQFEGDLHAQWFNIFMMDLLRERAADIYRSKGLLSFHGQGDTKFVFQGVHEQINVSFFLDWPHPGFVIFFYQSTKL
jgi:G3E family GTPase